MPVCIALLDLGHFKQVNDQHGHQVGDVVLQQFAALAAQSLRRSESFGRWGSEEFVLLLPGTDGHGAHQVLRRLHAALAAHDWGQVSPGQALSTSAGMALWQAGETFEAVLQHADQALYRAQAGGRSRSELAHDA